ncbi:MAG: nitroreductase [Flavobacteriales bacterium]|nr:nitroreductase [Flavobacteriales bacterium]
MKYNLSEINEVIRNRRSLMPEEYSARKVHKEIVQNILTNATWAPSHGLTQPWRFKVFMDDGLKQLSEVLPAMYKDFAPAEKFSEKKYNRFKERPLKTSVIIAVSMKRDPDGLVPEIEEIEAVACAVQNMYLTCTAYGLGGFWSSPGFIYTDKMREFLGLDPADKCLGLFYMGYPSGDWPRSHRKPLEYVTEWVTE